MLKWKFVLNVDEKEIKDSEESIWALTEKLVYKRARLKAVWRNMDSRTREYDKLLREIDSLCYKIKKLKWE